jgi:hypothetical protein
MRDSVVIAMDQSPGPQNNELKSVLTTLRKPTLWPNLEFLLTLLFPIHLRQKEIEGNTYHFGLVLRGWKIK